MATEEKTEETAEEKAEEIQTSENIPTSEAPAEASEKLPDTAAQEEEQKKQNQQNYDEAYRVLYTEILEHFRSFSPSEQIAGKITEEHITEYLESNREERLQAYKERREKRFLTVLGLITVLAAIVLIVWFLKDNPAILVNILYIFGGLGAFFIWRHPNTKNDKKE